MFRFWHVLIVFAAFVVTACSRSPYAASNRGHKKQLLAISKEIRNIPPNNLAGDSLNLAPQWIGTSNFSLRKPNYVILHYTAQANCEKTLQTFTRTATQVSAHYVICKDGIMHHLLNDYLRAWHAGLAKWGNDTDINSASIGIEIDNNGVDSFSIAQVKTLLTLLAVLKQKYNIPTANFIGHADIAPSRKSDPGILFPWKVLAEKGFGYWYGDTSSMVLPVSFDERMALRIIGYSVQDPAAAVNAFRLHFLQSAKKGEMDDAEKKVLFAVMQQYQ